ncbi:lysozyme inhibitor LprI family protein [Sphingomonas beigongshangi]|uniref:lysozyme inhibitor LprI family protein n=1 Tax=Sphingomonas beigongshangi TaxID=2782540 RepID=UPI00193BBE0C|nr:lysozyme inhibitor LprI family protein [Sphingomonas beigongshangi]
MFILALALAGVSTLDRCLASGDAARGVTDAMAACYDADYRRADAELNATYRTTMRRLTPSRQAVLRAAQRQWIARRDAACPLDLSPGAGTIVRLDHPACLSKQTVTRIAWLRRYR